MEASESPVRCREGAAAYGANLRQFGAAAAVALATRYRFRRMILALCVLCVKHFTTEGSGKHIDLK